jgi:shikimate dehydrogenase
VLILGAGGAARGAIRPFLEREPVVLDIENRTVEKAKALGDQFAMQRNLGTGGFSDFAGQQFDIVVERDVREPAW